MQTSHIWINININVLPTTLWEDSVERQHECELFGTLATCNRCIRVYIMPRKKKEMAETTQWCTGWFTIDVWESEIVALLDIFLIEGVISSHCLQRNDRYHSPKDDKI